MKHDVYNMQAFFSLLSHAVTFMSPGNIILHCIVIPQLLLHLLQNN